MAGTPGIDKGGTKAIRIQARAAVESTAIRGHSGDLLPERRGGYSEQGSTACLHRPAPHGFGESLHGGGWFHASVCLS